MALGPDRERVNNLITKTLRIGDVQIPKMIVGQVSVTGAGTITLPAPGAIGWPGIETITSVSATLAAAAASGEAFVTATFSGLVVTLSVYTSAYAASTTPTVVNYQIFGF